MALQAKTCTHCSKTKHYSDFNKKRNGLDSWCRTCRSDYWKTYYADPIKKKQHIVKNISRTKKQREEIRDVLRSLKEAVCEDCKKKYPYWVMQFDHLPSKGKKNFNVSKFAMKGHSLRKVLEEVKKCDVVCANCHADRTHKRRIGDGTGVRDTLAR